MKYARIELEVELPDNYDEGEIDTAIANAVAHLGGEVLDSKEFVEMKQEDLTNY
ncbi:hypothetical protein [Lentibacillus saliphilus]|uniref:hypothetical protein n=1 Tax=Lentibacillus saliphilus TaxID=2737028 RepID=UPI001C2FA6EE|nr:hypothetical protein [Lentibacillus saliphilus]